MLFIVNTLDVNNQIYPLAFGVGDSKNDASWTWFFEKLRGAIGCTLNLSIISDRNKSIENGVRRVFPEAFHGACMYHIGGNMKAKRFPDYAVNLFYKAAKCYRVSDFNQVMSHLRIFEDGRVYKYLEDAGFQKWARCHFPQDRYSIMKTNIAENMNGTLKEARMLRITSLMKYLVAMLQRWFHDRRKCAAAMTNEIIDHHEAVLRVRREKGSRMHVEPISYNEFHVRDEDVGGQVDLGRRSCSCKVFDIDHLSCAHACAAIATRNLSTTSLCSKYYTTDMLVLA